MWRCKDSFFWGCRPWRRAIGDCCVSRHNPAVKQELCSFRLVSLSIGDSNARFVRNEVPRHGLRKQAWRAKLELKTPDTMLPHGERSLLSALRRQDPKAKGEMLLTFQS